MAKYHINPETGNPGVCNAKVKCRFGDLEADHYISKEAAREAFEKRMEETAAPDKHFEERTSALRASLVTPSDIDYDAIAHELDWINQWEHPWTDAEKRNLGIVERISDLIAKDEFTAADEEKVQKLIEALEPAVVKQNRSGSWSSKDPDADNWRARDRMLHDLSKDLLKRRQSYALTFEPTADVQTNSGLIGLQDAQEAFLKHMNHPEYYAREGHSYMGDVEGHYQEAISRVVRGDSANPYVDNEGDRSLMPEADRIFNAMHPDNTVSSNLGNNQLYMAAVFPVNELKTEMERVGIDGVSVSTLDNGREQGNVYTVVTPDGSTRSFAVYEHRNTDSIIINGKAGWDGNDLPYAGETKEEFYAEFEPEDRKRAAQALTFYMAAAQKGTLEEDAELVRKATRRDWAAILDNSIAGFKEWRQSKVTDTYIAPEQENEEDILKRLDF